MSKVDISPPQTYSRLFRPWDNTKLNKKAEKEMTFNQANVNDSKFSNFYTIQENFDELDKKFNQSALAISSFALQNAIIDPLGLTSNIPITNEYYFGNPTGFSSVSPLTTFTTPSINSTPSSPNGLTAGMDPIAISFMEQEYARVMAEDAHLKALNSRKQRPKKFKCPHCDVAFSNNGQLKGHIRIHTGERPFKCDLESCGKTFTRNEELTRHKRIHTGLRPYGCSNCGKKFGRRDHLKKHMKTHMPQERHLGPAIYVPMYPYLYGY